MSDIHDSDCLVTIDLGDEMPAYRWPKGRCPRCGGLMYVRQEMNALSRYHDIYICPDCGVDEAMRDFMGEDQLPLDKWYAYQESKGVI